MQVFASMDPATPLADVGAHVRRVEALGFDGLHVAETVHDAFLVSLMALQSSSTLTVRTSVAVAFPRSPMVTALAAWDLAQVSGGRFSLGLGAQVRGNIVGRYSTLWSEPVSRMEEYVGALRAIFAAFQGANLDYQGEHYAFTRLQPYFNPGPGHEPSIWLGGVNPGMCQMAGRVADGLVTHPTSSIPAVLARIRRDAGPVPVVASAQFCTSDSDRAAKRTLLAYLYSTPAYRGALAEVGLEDRADRLNALSHQGSWDAMAGVVDDDMLDLIAPTTTYDQLDVLLSERYAGCAGVVIAPPSDPLEDDAMASALSRLRGGTV